MGKKEEQLGMAVGTAANRLSKMVLFDLLQRFELDQCVRCLEKIELIEELSMEHIEPWLNSKDPVGLYFDLNNIAFSHLSCNIKDKRDYRTKEIITLTCANCNKTFERTKYKVTPKKKVGQKDFYCSHKCSGHATNKGYGRRDYE